MTLAERIDLAAAAPPLSELSGAQRAELEREVGLASVFEDLPGWWQAAVLEAEGAAAAGHGHCCHGGS